MRPDEISHEAARKAKNAVFEEYAKRKPLLWSFIALLFGLITLPIWVKGKYQKGYFNKLEELSGKEKGKPTTYIRYHLISALLGAVIGFMFNQPSLGIAVMMIFTFGTIYQLSKYEKKGEKDASRRFSQEQEKILERIVSS